MNSPIWIRKNIGNPHKQPGIPFQNPKKFTKWLNATIGNPKEVTQVVLIGLTIDCCVFCTAQELSWRGYNVSILREAVDVYSGNSKEKEIVLNGPSLSNWAKIISWKDLKEKLNIQK